MTGFVYAIQAGNRVKIGWSSNPRLRAVKIRADNAEPANLIGAVAGTKAQEAECHRLLSPWRMFGEWFDATAFPVAEFCRLLPPVNSPKARGFISRPPISTEKHTPFAREVEAFLEASGLTATQFGRLSANDPKLVFDMRGGRELRAATMRRVADFMASAVASKAEGEAA